MKEKKKHKLNSLLSQHF